jgi:hypothetical protein
MNHICILTLLSFTLSLAGHASENDEGLNLSSASLFVRGPRLSETVVSIGALSKTLNKSTSCSMANWGNNLQNSCQCCLAKHLLEQDDPGTAVNYCINEKNYCSLASINAISENLGLASGASSADRALAIYKSIDKLPVLELSEPVNPKLSDMNVIGFLAQAEKDRWFTFTNKMSPSSNEQCYRAKQLGINSAATLQLILVSYAVSCPNLDSNFEPFLIIKEMKKGIDEVKNLLSVELALKGTDQESLNVFALPLFNFAYFDNKKSAHFMSVLPLAQGKSLREWLEDYYASPNIEKEDKLKNMFFNYGKSLAKLHIKHMIPQGSIFGKTFLHNDAHLANIFSTSDGKITFIDVETLAETIANRASPLRDLLFFFIRIIGETKNDLIRIKGLDFDTTKQIEGWIGVSAGPFIKGYAQEYMEELGASRKSEILNALKNAFVEQTWFSLSKLGLVMNVFTFSSQYNRFKPYLEKVINSI